MTNLESSIFLRDVGPWFGYHMDILLQEYGQKESEMLGSEILLTLGRFEMGVHFATTITLTVYCITLIAVRLAPHLQYRPFLRSE